MWDVQIDNNGWFKKGFAKRKSNISGWDFIGNKLFGLAEKTNGKITFISVRDSAYNYGPDFTHITYNDGKEVGRGTSWNVSVDVESNGGIEDWELAIPLFDLYDQDGVNKYLSSGDVSNALNANDLEDYAYGNKYMDVYIDGTTRPNIKVGLTTENKTDDEGNPFFGKILVYAVTGTSTKVIEKSISINEMISFSFDSVIASADYGIFKQIQYETSKLFDGVSVRITGYIQKDSDVQNNPKTVGRATGEVTYKANTKVIQEQSVIIRFHTNSDSDEAENDGYTDSTSDTESDSGETTLDTVGLLTTTYVLTNERLTNIANKLWDSSFLDNIKLVNNNPIENICSVKILPVSVSGVEKEVYIGNVGFGINGEKISSNYAPYYSKRLNINPKADLPLWANYAPFTKMSIYLPYIGYKDLDINKFMGRSIQVKYVVDVLTGMCKAVISNDIGKVISFDGNCGVDIPITASNKAQHDISFIQSVAGGVASVASGDISGLSKNILGAVTNPFSSQTHGCNTPTCSSNEGNVIALYIDYPHIQYPSTFAKENGLPCNLSLVLKNCKGFTKVASDNIDLSGIPCLDEEKERLRNILTSGFIANW